LEHIDVLIVGESDANDAIEGVVGVVAVLKAALEIAHVKFEACGFTDVFHRAFSDSE
jgi:hypothetical protein